MILQRAGRSRILSPHRQLRALYCTSKVHMVSISAPVPADITETTNQVVECMLLKSDVPKLSSLSVPVAAQSHHRLRHVQRIPYR